MERMWINIGLYVKYSYYCLLSRKTCLPGTFKTGDLDQERTIIGTDSDGTMLSGLFHNGERDNGVCLQEIK